jgi:hypothetical protein
LQIPSSSSSPWSEASRVLQERPQIILSFVIKFVGTYRHRCLNAVEKLHASVTDPERRT